MVHTHGQRFDANCSILFTELPLLKRPAAAQSAGFGRIQAVRSGGKHYELRLEVTAHAAGPGEV
jgi:hydroxypyruvate isomerase